MLIASEKIFDYFNVLSIFFSKYIKKKFLSIRRKRSKPTMEKAWNWKTTTTKPKTSRISIPMSKEVTIVLFINKELIFCFKIYRGLRGTQT